MNFAIIFYILGSVIKIEGILMLFPAAVAVIYREMSGIWFLLCAAACIVAGFLMSRKRPENCAFYAKEGFITVSLSWIVLSLIGALPFTLSGEIPFYIDGLFEIISGFTTTGSSILTDVEALSHCMLFWRSFSHWIGGMGVLVFLLAIIPMSGGSNINLMRAESPGPSVGKLVPKMKDTVRILYLIYSGLTVAEIVLLLLGGMPFFDALCTSLGTAGTGGFGIRNDSIAGYSPYLQWVTTIFMILFGVNFNAYCLLLFRKIKDFLRMEEVRCYLLIIFASVAFIAGNILKTCTGIFDAVTKAAFQVASIITTTGFSTTDFQQWPESSKAVLVLLMFVGACAGSTGGGIKVSRFVVLFKTVRKEFFSYIHPKSIKKIKMDGKPIDHDVVRSINVYMITFMVLFVISVFLISFENTDLVTSFTAVAATINNIGPGLELVGPTGNFGFFSPFSKYVLMFDMLAGRLELFPLLLLFHPTIWKDLFAYKKTVWKEHHKASRLNRLAH